MGSSEIGIAALLAGALLLVLRVSQRAAPSLYFTTSSFFETRAEVRGRAILFRMALPALAGAAAALVAPDHEMAIASLAGGIGWFLAIWPVMWNPSLLPHPRRALIWLLLLAFWAAYALLPVAGVAVYELIEGVARNRRVDWTEEIVKAAVTTLPISTVIWLTSRAANSRVTFVDDLEEESAEVANEFEGYSPSILDRAQYSAAEIAAVASAATLLLVIGALVFRGFHTRK